MKSDAHTTAPDRKITSPGNSTQHEGMLTGDPITTTGLLSVHSFDQVVNACSVVLLRSEFKTNRF